MFIATATGSSILDIFLAGGLGTFVGAAALWFSRRDRSDEKRKEREMIIEETRVKDSSLALDAYAIITQRYEGTIGNLQTQITNLDTRFIETQKRAFECETVTVPRLEGKIAKLVDQIEKMSLRPLIPPGER